MLHRKIWLDLDFRTVQVLVGLPSALIPDVLPRKKIENVLWMVVWKLINQKYIM